jgi:hypothetical protein
LSLIWIAILTNSDFSGNNKIGSRRWKS